MPILIAQEMLVAIIIIINVLQKFYLRVVFRDFIEIRVIMPGKKHMS